MRLLYLGQRVALPRNIAAQGERNEEDKMCPSGLESAHIASVCILSGRTWSLWPNCEVREMRKCCFSWVARCPAKTSNTVIKEEVRCQCEVIFATHLTEADSKTASILLQRASVTHLGAAERGVYYTRAELLVS